MGDTELKQLEKVCKSDEECFIFRCGCLGAHCIAYEQLIETAYRDTEKNEWVGLYAIELMNLTEEQQRVRRHCFITRRCSYFDKRLSKEENIDFFLPETDIVRKPPNFTKNI